MTAQILVAEDDPKQAELLRRYLEQDGHEVAVAHDGRAALDTARTWRLDLVVLDVMLPRVDGHEVCRALRAHHDVPIIMVTARTTEEDVLSGLDLGADDYVTKPFSPRELVARIRALLRRAAPGQIPHDPEDVVAVGDVVIDARRHEVHVAGVPVACTPTELRILACLAEWPGEVVTRRRLLDTAFDEPSEVQARTVDAHVRNLRKKIEDDARRPRRLVTVHRVGYRLLGDPAG